MTEQYDGRRTVGARSADTRRTATAIALAVVIVSRAAAQQPNAPISCGPTWSPRGDRIAFHSDRDGHMGVYVMDTTGRAVSRVFNDTVYTAQASWSPDETRLVVARGAAGHRHLVIVRPDGSDARELASADGTAAWPAWSPDGKTILFDWDAGGNRDIYKVSADGGVPIRLTTDAATDNLARWHPTGTSIVFDSKRSGHWEVFVMRADGSGARMLDEGAVPVFSRSGDRIVYQKSVAPQGTNFFVTGPTGPGADGAAQALTSGPHHDASASFGPNDASIVFCSDREGSYEIFRMRADGRNVVRITHTP